MKFNKFRWSKVYESSEEELLELLESMGHEHIVRELPAAEALLDETQASAVQFWCAEGSAIVSADNAHVSIQPGDCITLLAGTTHSISAGIAGCTWYQTAYQAD